MKDFLRCAVLAAALTTGMAVLPAQADDATAQTAPVKHHRVVFQISDSAADRWRMLLANAKKVQQTFGKQNVDIEVVALGPGIDQLRFESVLGDDINQALDSGIKIVACENTMKAKHLTNADMLPNIGYVPSGAVELIEKEEAGWVYLRP